MSADLTRIELVDSYYADSIFSTDKNENIWYVYSNKYDDRCSGFSFEEASMKMVKILEEEHAELSIRIKNLKQKMADLKIEGIE